VKIHVKQIATNMEGNILLKDASWNVHTSFWEIHRSILRSERDIFGVHDE